MAGFEEGGMCKGGGERFGALLEPSYMPDGYFQAGPSPVLSVETCKSHRWHDDILHAGSSEEQL